MPKSPPGKDFTRVEPTQTDQAGASPRGSSSPLSASKTLVDAVRIAPAPSLAPRRTRAPSTTIDREPTKASSSMTTGTALGGSNTPPTPTPPERCTRLPIWPQDPDGGPGVDHGAFVDVAADVDEARKQHRAWRDVGTPAHDGPRHHADAVEVRLQRHPIVIAKIARGGLGHRQHFEGEQNRPLRPFIYDDGVGVRIHERHPGLSGVQRVDGAHHERAGVGVVRVEFGSALPERVDLRGQRTEERLVHGRRHYRRPDLRCVPVTGCVPVLMPPRTPRGRRRARKLTASVIGIALIFGVIGAAIYGWHQLTHHQLSADSCQVVGNGVSPQTYTMDPEQLLNASIIADVAMRRALPEKAVIVALATAQQESKLRNLDYGDADSLGLFQQRPSQGWGTAGQVIQPVYAAGKFYDTLLKVANWQGLSVGEAAQDVQRSAFPQAYASWEPRATALAGALTGTTFGQLTCRLVHPGVAALAAAAATSSGGADAGAAASSPAASSPAITTPTVAASALIDGLRNDLAVNSPSVDRVDAKTTTVTVLGLGATAAGGDVDALHRDASVAAWAIAHAAADGITAVVLGNQEWRPDRNGWHPTKKPAVTGHVVITVARA